MKSRRMVQAIQRLYNEQSVFHISCFWELENNWEEIGWIALNGI